MTTTSAIFTLLENQLQTYLEDLRTLVSIDSGSYHQAGVNAVNDWLETRLAGLGFAVERQPHPELGDNLLGIRRGSGRGKIVLLGHSDTVYPPGTAVQRPMVIQGDKILGPGACDMKAGLLNGIYALEALQAIGFDAYETLYYLAVPDEEIGTRHSIPLIRATGRQADAVLTLESARENGDIVTARKMMGFYQIEAFGRAAHAGVEPEKGSNAILALAHHMLALDKLNGLRPGVTVNIGTIEGGSLPNIVPDYAKMRLDLRTFSAADMQILIEAIQAQLGKPTIPGVTVKAALEKDSVMPAMERTPAVMALEKLAQQAARELGFEIKGASTGGAADGGFAAAEGAPVLDGLGPVGGRDHSPDEYINLSSIVPRTALLAKLIMAITKHKNSTEN